MPNHIRQIKNKGTFINFTEYIIIFNRLFKGQKKMKFLILNLNLNK